MKQRNRRRGRIKASPLKALRGYANYVVTGKANRLSPTVRGSLSSRLSSHPSDLMYRTRRLGGDDHDHEDNLSSPSSSSTQTVEEPTKIEQLKHLQMLIDVFDSDLKPMFDLRRDIKAGTLTHIAFQDLWHLFQYGQDVRTNNNESQVYRVVRWTGGRPDHFIPPPPPPSQVPRVEKAKGYKLDFQVDCVYLDFDGHLYAPGYKRSVIRKYEGEKAITSLPIFPIAFTPNPVKLRKRLTARGDRWLQLTRPDSSTHKHYTGLTLDLPQAYEVS
jgi:hypothetical protein